MSSPAQKSATLPRVFSAPSSSSFTAGNAPHISPANKHTTAKGKISSTFFTAINPSSTPAISPKPMGNKKRKHFLNCLRRLPSAYKNWSYNLKIIATVEPLIPGTITASPIKNPSNALLHHVFLLYLISAISKLSSFILHSFFSCGDTAKSRYPKTETRA